MEKNRPTRKGRGGRPAKTDTASHCVMVRFNDTEPRPLSDDVRANRGCCRKPLLARRGSSERVPCDKNRPRNAEYVAKLTQLQRSIQSRGNELQPSRKAVAQSHFSERKALAMLSKLENATKELRGCRPTNHCTFGRV